LYSLEWILALVLAVSFLSNVSPFVGASYTLLAAINLTLVGVTPFNFGAVVVVSAAGATLAKVAIYYGAFGLRKYLVRNRNIRLIGRYSSRESYYVVLFAAALLPIFPFDDYIYIGAGATSVSLGLMSVVTLGAKTVKSAAEIALEVTILKNLSQVLDLHRLDLTLVLTALFVVIGVVVYKVDWESLYARLRSRGQPRPVAPEPKPDKSL
jgi:uncharacterized membrane protein YdjX (TVP38/TMEM64 family)